jgi:hypothetical protein
MTAEKPHVNPYFVLVVAFSGLLWGAVIGLAYRYAHVALRILR